MPDIDLSVEALGQLRPNQLLDLLERLDIGNPGFADLDINLLGRQVDPRRLDRDQFVRLLGGLDRLAGLGDHLDFSRLDANTFARIIARASTAQLEAAMSRSRLRRSLLTEVFRRMGDHLRPERVRNIHAVVHWRVAGGTGAGGYDRYETVIENGGCVVTTELARDPRVTITVGPAEFLRLVTGNASAPMLFLTGKVRVKGDLGFAAGLTGLFNLPTVGR